MVYSVMLSSTNVRGYAEDIAPKVNGTALGRLHGQSLVVTQREYGFAPSSEVLMRAQCDLSTMPCAFVPHVRTCRGSGV